jgi:hypothetical protein
MMVARYIFLVVSVDSPGRTNGFSLGTLFTSNKKGLPTGALFITGGEGGIRTHGTLARTPDFESGTFGHSVTSPRTQDYRETRGKER